MTVSLGIGATLWEGWKRVAVQRSLEQAAADFRLELTDRWPGALEGPRPIRVGEECRLAVDGTPVIAGHIDALRLNLDADRRTIQVAGRERTADLVDCAAPIQAWSDVTIQEIARDLAKQFGVAVSGNAGVPLESFATEPGETCYEAIARAARLRGRLVTSTGLGTLLLAPPSRGRAGTDLVVGGNVLRLAARVDYSQRYSSYEVLAQQAGNSTWLTAEETAGVSARVRDPAIARERPWTLLGDQGLSSADAQARCEWELSIRMGRSTGIDVTVQGWRERPGGALWEPGRLVRVRGASAGFDGRDYLVSTVRWSIGEDGTLTQLLLVLPEAFQPEPEPSASTPAGDGWIPE